MRLAAPECARRSSPQQVHIANLVKLLRCSFGWNKLMITLRHDIVADLSMGQCNFLPTNAVVSLRLIDEVDSYNSTVRILQPPTVSTEFIY
jgi:hypothetical protein